MPHDFVVPDGTLPATPSHLLPLPPAYQQHMQQQNPQAQMNPDGSLVERTDGFHVPDYNQSSRQYLDDEAEFRDALIKEVKAQKKNVNKLLREVDALKLLVTKLVDALSPQPAPTEPQSINDTSTES